MEIAIRDNLMSLVFIFKKKEAKTFCLPDRDVKIGYYFKAYWNNLSLPLTISLVQNLIPGMRLLKALVSSCLKGL